MSAWRETWSAAGPGTTDPMAPFGVVMLADLLTKAASRAIFTGLIKQLD